MSHELTAYLMFSTGFTSLSVSHSLFLCTVFDSISANIGKVLSIKLSVNAFAFGDVNVHHKDLLTYSGRTDRSGQLL